MSPQTDVQNSTERQSSVSGDKILLTISLTVRQQIPSLHRSGAADPICRDHKYECCSGHIFSSCRLKAISSDSAGKTTFGMNESQIYQTTAAREPRGSNVLRPVARFSRRVRASPRLSVEGSPQLPQACTHRADADQRVGGLPPSKKCVDQGDARWSRPARPAKRSAKLARGLSDSRRLFGTALTETPAGLDGNMIASR
jgi:hypothetical protein